MLQHCLIMDWIGNKVERFTHTFSSHLFFSLFLPTISTHTPCHSIFKKSTKKGRKSIPMLRTTQNVCIDEQGMACAVLLNFFSYTEWLANEWNTLENCEYVWNVIQYLFCSSTFHITSFASNFQINAIVFVFVLVVVVVLQSGLQVSSHSTAWSPDCKKKKTIALISCIVLVEC